MVANANLDPRRCSQRSSSRSSPAGTVRIPSSLAASLPPPALDLRVVPGQQHVRYSPAAMLRRAGVVRVLGEPFKALAEGLLHARARVAESARQLAQHRVAQHHRGELAAREHIAPDRDLIACEVLHDALVEALVAPTQKRERGLA